MITAGFILDRIKTLSTGLTITGSNVYLNNNRAKQDVPALAIYQSGFQLVDQTLPYRHYNLTVTITAMSDSETELNTIYSELSAAILSTRNLNLVDVIDTSYPAISNYSSDNQYRTFDLVFDVMYRTLANGLAPVYYVSTVGNDSNPGTFDAPWLTIEHAASVAIAGDTVLLQDGEYIGQFYPDSSGTFSDPITLKGLNRRGAVLKGPSSDVNDGYAIYLNDRNYIIIDGIDLSVDYSYARCAYISGVGCEVTDCVIAKTSNESLPLVRIDGASNCYFSDNDVDGQGIFNSFQVLGTNGAVFEGNTFTHSRHDPFLFYPAATNNNIVVRGNVFHSKWGRNFEMLDVSNVLFEKNIVANGYNGTESGDEKAKVFTQNGIFRKNKFIQNWGVALHADAYSDETILKNTRFYNNIFADNNRAGIDIGGTAARVSGIKFTNNIFYNGDLWGSGAQVRLKDTLDFYDATFDTNIFYPESVSGELGIAIRNGSGIFINETSAVLGAKSINNANIDPGFNDENYYPGVNAISAGTNLAVTVGSGSGNVVIVDDAKFFYDGFGIPGEVGDIIDVGGSQARVTSVDVDANTLTLNNTISWSSGVGVNLAYSGAAPDIGWHETGSDISISFSPASPVVGEVVTFTAVNAPTGAIITWKFADNVYTGSAQRSFATEESHAVTLKVESGGNVYRDSAVVCIANTTGTLVSHTFAPDDDGALYRWDYIDGINLHGEIVTTSEPIGYALEINDSFSDATAWITPEAWDIDAYPTITIRYAIRTGMELALYLYAFEDETGVRNLNIAETDSAALIGTPAANRLDDDESFHTLVLDARDIRSAHAGVTHLYRVLFRIKFGGFINVGDYYQIESFSITT